MALASVTVQRERDKFVSDRAGSTAVRVQESETVPTDDANNNPSITLTYTGSNLTGLSMVIGGVTYTKTLTYDGSNLTAISAWS